MDLDRLKLAYRKSSTNIWLVRATGGKFLDHFRQDNLVAIGHLDDVYPYAGEVTYEVPGYSQVESYILRKIKYTVPIEGSKRSARKLNGSGTKKLNQIDSFSSKVKIGDIIVSTDGSSLLIGVCSSHAYLDPNPVLLNLPPEVEAEHPSPRMVHRLRRDVVWGPQIPRHSLPSSIKKTLQGQQTIIDFRKHWDKFYHLMYPFFVDENYLYISNKITSSGAVSNLFIGGLLQNISLMQQFAKEIEETGEIDLDSIARLLNFELDISTFSATTKAEFMSPGDLWNRIPLDGFSDKARGALLCIMITLILTGHAKAEDFSGNSPSNIPVAEVVTPSEMVEDIFRTPKKKNSTQQDVVRDIQANAEDLNSASEIRNTKKIKTSLALNLPTIDTQAIEKFDYGIPAVRLFEGSKLDK